MDLEITKGELVHEILREFIERNPKALVAIAATNEGLSLASVRQGISEREEEFLAVAAAQILDMTREANKQLNQGHIGRILIEGSQRTTIVTRAGRDVNLIVVVPADAKLGLPMLTMRTTAQLIAKVYD